MSFLAHNAVVSRDHAYALNIQDTLKISGAQVSPVEIEKCLLEHPGKFINDLTVAGVSGGRITDEKVPRAWIVLSSAGKKHGVASVVRELNAWHQKNLSKYKWLRGGIQVVEEVCFLPLPFLYILCPRFLAHHPFFRGFFFPVVIGF